MTQSPPPVYPAPSSPGGPSVPPPPVGEKHVSGLAVAALVLGILSLCVPLVGIVAIVLGIIAINRVDNPAHSESGRGMALAGTILGGVGTILIIVAFLIGMMLPALGAARSTARQMQSNTQLRGVHQAMVIYAQSNHGLFPGLTQQGPDVHVTDATVAGRFEELLQNHYFTPEYLISPLESDPAIGEHWGSGPFTSDNYSYALLSIRNPGQRQAEWSETLNSHAIVMGDRNIGHTSDDHAVQSLHTQYPGDWRGGVAYNDNSVTFEIHHRLPTRYGSSTQHTDDHLFQADSNDDALLIHDGE